MKPYILWERYIKLCAFWLKTMPVLYFYSTCLKHSPIVATGAINVNRFNLMQLNINEVINGIDTHGVHIAAVPTHTLYCMYIH